MGNVKCRDCVRLYSGHTTDQCDIPNTGITSLHKSIGKSNFLTGVYDMDDLTAEELFDLAVNGKPEPVSDEDREKAEFFLSRTKHVHTTEKGQKVYGHPSQLNYDNTCVFFLPKDKKVEKRRIMKLIKNLFGMKH